MSHSTLVLDPTLSAVNLPSFQKARTRMLESTFTAGANTYDWRTGVRTVTEEHFDMGLPEVATIFHQNYLDYLSQSYSVHTKIVLSPDIFWYTVLCEIAQYVVANPEQHRAIFTRDISQKKEISVPCLSEDEALHLDSIYDELVSNVPVDTAIFLPQFSTTTEMARLSMLAAFSEICSPYYSYSMYCCGFPAVKLLGLESDWDANIDRLLALSQIFGKMGSQLQRHLSEVVLPVAEKIRSAVDGHNSDWFKTIFTETPCGSGSQVDIDGWFCRLLMVQPEHSPRQLCNFATHVTRVPYTTLPSNRKWNICFGLFYSNLDADGFAVPEFSWVQNVRLSQPRLLEK